MRNNPTAPQLWRSPARASVWSLLCGLALVVALAQVASCSSAARKPVLGVRDSKSAPTFSAPKGMGRVTILFDQRFSGFDDASMQLLVGRPGMRLPRHRHPTSHEILYILEGSATMFVIDPTSGKRRVQRVRKGMAIWIPRGIEHGVTVDSNGPTLRALQLYTPAGPEQRFRAWKRAPTTRRSPGKERGPR